LSRFFVEFEDELFGALVIELQIENGRELIFQIGLFLLRNGYGFSVVLEIFHKPLFFVVTFLSHGINKRGLLRLTLIALNLQILRDSLGLFLNDVNNIFLIDDLGFMRLFDISLGQ